MLHITEGIPGCYGHRITLFHDDFLKLPTETREEVEKLSMWGNFDKRMTAKDFGLTYNQEKEMVSFEFRDENTLAKAVAVMLKGRK